MRRTPVTFTSVFAALALVSFAHVASAQETKTVVTVADNANDHDTVVGHFAVGYFGISNLPVGSLGTGGVAAGAQQANIIAPVIGARYWLLPKLGIDAGVGFSDSKDGWGVALHGGVPLALATSKHLAFELIPEVTVAFAGNSETQGNVNYTFSGFLLDIGARIGGEIQFGFIGIPQLALQGSVGVYLQHTSAGFSTNTQSGSTNGTTLTTSVGSDPWGIFTDNISALYYF